MKNSMIQKVLFAICLLMVLFLFASALAEPTVVASGPCGEKGSDITWTLYSDGGLYFTGSGTMKSLFTPPWGNTSIRESIKYAVVGSGIDNLGDYALSSLPNLESVTFSEGLKKIGISALRGCPKLNGVQIPSTVSYISTYAFADCSSLTSIKIPGKVTFLSSYLFYNCRALQTVDLPESLTSFKGSAFSGCISLRNFTIPEGVKELSSSIFSGCTFLETVIIPRSLTSIGASAFFKCPMLTLVCDCDSCAVTYADKHGIKIDAHHDFVDGICTRCGYPARKFPPKTGDGFPLVLCMVMLLPAGVGLALNLRKKRFHE